MTCATEVPVPEPVPPLSDPIQVPPPPPPPSVPPDEDDGSTPPPVRLPGRPGTVPERVAAGEAARVRGAVSRA